MTLFSIVVVTKNNAPTIRHVLSSTLTLADKYDVELIMVDGNSKDNTPKILGDFAENIEITLSQ
jgi:glycosyltransferase involved in cell wall biosynthesis